LAAGREEVKVSDFGWDAEDSTRIVQAALDSGAKRVVFDRQSGPWIVTPVKARSNTEIVFEDGVELQAKKGTFQGIHEYLMEFSSVTNVSLIGRGDRGGILRMHKSDYQKAPYAPSEWRHALAIRGSVDIRVENMSFIHSGGDGISIGGEKGGLDHSLNVTIRRSVCDGNNRQGISVCSVENLLIEDTELKNTNGRLPKAGIDFEPDHGGQRIVNCTMRRCHIEGNAGNGILIYLGAQNFVSKRSGITVEDCTIVGNGANGISVTVGGTDKRVKPPTGEISFSDCLIAGNRNGSIELSRKPAGYPIAFIDCTATNQRQGVSFLASGWGGELPDGVTFSNYTAYCSKDQNWFKSVPESRGLNPKVPVSVTGNVTVIRPDGRENEIVLDKAWAQAMFALPSSRTPPDRVLQWPKDDKCTVHDATPGKMEKLTPLQRGGSWRGIRYSFFAERPGKVHFKARYVRNADRPFPEEGKIVIGKGRYSHPRSRNPLALLPPIGITSEVFSVEVPYRGFYYMAMQGFHTPFLLEESDVPVAIDVHDPIRVIVPNEAECRLYMTVPEGTDSFAFLAKGKLRSRLFSPDGTLSGVCASAGTWELAQMDKPVSGLWRIDFDKSGNATCSLDIVGVPGLLWLSPSKTVTWR
jgi:hypothetical protein